MKRKKNTVTKGNFRKHFLQLAVLEDKIQNSEEGMTAAGAGSWQITCQQHSGSRENESEVGHNTKLSKSASPSPSSGASSTGLHVLRVPKFLNLSQAVLPTGNHVLKCIILWETLLSKLVQKKKKLKRDEEKNQKMSILFLEVFWTVQERVHMSNNSKQDSHVWY